MNLKGGGDVNAVLERLKQGALIYTMRQIAPVYPITRSNLQKNNYAHGISNSLVKYTTIRRRTKCTN
jgi:hypothetical protein